MDTALQATYGRTSGLRAPELLIYRDSYRYAIKPFARFAGDDEITLETVRAYYRELNNSDLSPSSIRVRRQAVVDRIRRKFAYATPQERDKVEQGLREINRDPDLKCPAQQFSPPGDSKVLSLEEYHQVLASCRSNRQLIFMRILWETGARVSEATGITLADCTVEDKVVTVRLRGKGNRNASYKVREVFIPRGLYDDARSVFAGEEYLLETAGGKRYSRSYVSDQIAKITRKAIGRRLSAHKLRHSFATRTLKSTGRLTAVSRYLGHSDVSITAKYYAHDTLSPADVLGTEVAGV